MPEYATSKPYRVLSIDGGGIRGVIPSRVLVEVEKLTRRPLHDCFDLIVGTSTGGILALGAACPDPEDATKAKFSAKDLMGIWVNQGQRIFPRSDWPSVLTWFDEAYDEAGLEGVLAEKFGKTELKDALTDVFITSYAIDARRPYFFKSHKAKTDEDRNHLMVDVGRATSAAPTYFTPHQIDHAGGFTKLTLVDGGVVANNPAMCAYSQAGKCIAQGQDLMLLSLGTGKLTRSILKEDADGWGLIKWARPMLDILFSGASDATHYHLEQLMGPSGSKGYLRLQGQLNTGSDNLDDTSDDNVAALIFKGEEIIGQNRSALEDFCARL